MGSVVLLSGGMDSVVAFYWALQNATTDPSFAPVHCVTFDYGQRHRKEIQFAVATSIEAGLSERYGGYCGYHQTIDMHYLFPRRGSLVGDVPTKMYNSPPTVDQAQSDPAFVPFRNLIFLATAAAWAREWKAVKLVTGLRGGFPDCTRVYEQDVENVLYLSDNAFPRLQIVGPAHCSRAKLLELAESIPECFQALANTWTCFVGEKEPCGKCLPCLARAKGFTDMGRLDPLLVRLQREREV